MKQNFCFSTAWVRMLLFCCCAIFGGSLSAQDALTLKGKVVDAVTNESLIGVSITEKNTSNGCVTDIDGNFTLKCTSKNAIVVFSYIGYHAHEQKAGAIKNIIKLSEDSKLLNEVVVVGYGIQKKVNLTGSVAAIEGDKIAAKPTTDAVAALQGELPGVTIFRNGGKPGSETGGIRIRGFSSVNSASTLVLIDGVEGDLKTVNPNDIESISVLKDAASCAIYGARAAAGVVLVTMKSGTEGKPKISYNGSYSFFTPGNMPERLPAWEEQFFIDESRLQASGKAEWSAEKASWVGNPNFNDRPLANGRWDFFSATNWVDEALKDYTSQQSHSVSVNGGTKSTNYLFSANYYKKDGLLKYGPDDASRVNLLAKVNTSFNKYIDFGLNVQYQSGLYQSIPIGSEWVFGTAFQVRGRQPVYVPEGDKSGNIYNGDLQQNVVDVMKNSGVDKTKNEYFIGKGLLTLKDFVKGLRINLSASRKAGYFSEDKKSRTIIWKDRFGKNERGAHNRPNSLYRKKSSDYHDVMDATVNYTFDINQVHNFNILAGSSYENFRSENLNAEAKYMISNDFFSFGFYEPMDLEKGTKNDKIGDGIFTWSMMSYFGRLNYNYKERYLFEANIRHDGSSRLAPGNRWKSFPSVSAAWRINQESWFNLDFISNLKIRASWGQLGNGSTLGLYDYIPTISNGTYLTEKTYYQNALAATDKTWEVIETTNFGVDFGLLNNRLTGSFEYYLKYNNDMLASLQLPSQIGISVPKVNVGQLKTWGWDFNIGWRDTIKDFNYQVSFNLSDTQNELVKYDGTNTIQEGQVHLLQGYAINTLWGYKTDGYWNSREEYLKYKEENPGFKTFDDGVIASGDVKYVAQGKADHEVGVGGATPDNPGDLVCLGNSEPRFLYGLNLAAQWKGFDLSVMFQGVGERTVMMNSGIAPLTGTSIMPLTIHRDYWTPENTDAYWPRLYSGKGFNYKASDKWLQDASYIRLKNITLGYTVPISKKYIDRLRIYFSGDDIWEHSDMLSIFDPEVANNQDRSLYPFFRSWTIGLNLSF